MKNNVNSTKMLNEKHVLYVVSLFIGILLLTTYANAQQLSEQITFNSSETEKYVVREFSGKQINSTVYFKFLILENRTSAMYTLESSSDGKTYNKVDNKIGYASPYNQPLLYCYKTAHQPNIDQFYRVKIESPNETSYSQVVRIKAGGGSLIAKTN